MRSGSSTSQVPRAQAPGARNLGVSCLSQKSWSSILHAPGPTNLKTVACVDTENRLSSHAFSKRIWIPRRLSCLRHTRNHQRRMAVQTTFTQRFLYAVVASESDDVSDLGEINLQALIPGALRRHRGTSKGFAWEAQHLPPKI